MYVVKYCWTLYIEFLSVLLFSTVHEKNKQTYQGYNPKNKDKRHFKVDRVSQSMRKAPVAARRCLPPGANVCVCCPRQSDQGIFRISNIGV